jgi:Leucine-rich repeat (LRR) protein
MRFAKRYISYLVLFVLLIALGSLFFVVLASDEKVTFEDQNLEATIREVLDQPAKDLHASSLSKITELDLSGRGITSLSGIEYLSNLTILNLENNKVKDVSPLARLRKLRKLNLRTNDLIRLEDVNFESLANAPLTHLNLDNNAVVRENGQRIWLSDIRVLSNFSSLQELTLSENKITDISPLSTLSNLKSLSLQYNLIEDISPLRRSRFLKTLNLGNNKITDLTPLAELYRLVNLDLRSNKNIASLRPLEDLTRLKTLFLGNVPVGDEISVLANKRILRELSIENAQIVDITAFKDLKNLTSLNLRGNNIVDLAPLSGLTKLEYLNVQLNRNIDSIAPLASLIRLEKLDIQDVPIGDEVSVLANFERLEFLDARNCGISDTRVLGALMERGALQDQPASGKTASIDLRDNPIPVSNADAYQPIRAHWSKIDERLPFALPEYTPLAAPVFSALAGFYEEPFELAITSDLVDANIYYTRNGSEPTIESIRYTAPILIQSRAGEPNKLSENPRVSPSWKSPNGEVMKATVIRARVISADGAQSSPIVTNTFLVDPDKRYSLPVISIVTNPAYLFNYRYGIYVMGEIYDQYDDPVAGVNPWERAANYTQRGAAWERPLHIEYFAVNGVREVSQDASVRIQGAATRERTQKSLRIYARCVNPCQSTFDYELFPGLTSTATGAPIQQFKTFLLRNSGNDWEKSMFRDALVQSLVQDTRLDAQAYQPTIVFLNGEYWGIHNLRERLDEYYLESHYGIDPRDVVILTENSAIVTGEAGDQQHYLDMLEFIRTHDMAVAENYEYIQTQMDVDNFIDYQIAEIYSDNTNWPNVNIKYWRKKTAGFEPNAPYGQDGRWRWMLFDTDFGFDLSEEGSSDHNNLRDAIQPNWNEWAGFLLRSLLQNPEFQTKFLSRFADQLNSAFLPRHVVEKINQMQAVLEPEIAEHIRRWRGKGGTMEEWQDSVNVMRDFAALRPENVQKHLIEYFALGGTSTLRVVVDAKMGYLRVNSLDLLPGTPGVADPGAWEGVYFDGVPVDIRAVAYPGFRFERWEGVDGEVAGVEQLSLALSGDVRLRAVFSKE